MIKKTHRVLCAFILIFAALCFSSCKTVPTSIPDGISEAELLQLGQSAIDSSNYKAAEFYYKKVIELYGSNINTVVEAEYELAHIKIKQKKYKEAKIALEKILFCYENDQTGLLVHMAYKKLAQTDLQKCEPELKNTKN